MTRPERRTWPPDRERSALPGKGVEKGAAVRA
jgi:hypothetical protein